jgi:hypothetical protein
MVSPPPVVFQFSMCSASELGDTDLSTRTYLLEMMPNKMDPLWNEVFVLLIDVPLAFDLPELAKIL